MIVLFCHRRRNIFTDRKNGQKKSTSLTLSLSVYQSFGTCILYIYIYLYCFLETSIHARHNNTPHFSPTVSPPQQTPQRYTQCYIFLPTKFNTFRIKYAHNKVHKLPFIDDDVIEIIYILSLANSSLDTRSIIDFRLHTILFSTP